MKRPESEPPAGAAAPGAGPEPLPEPPGKGGHPGRGRARWLRAELYRILEGLEPGDPATLLLNGMICVIILVSVLAVVLETVPSLDARWHRAFLLIEVATLTLFTLEYLIRLWVAVEDPRYRHPVRGRLRYALTPLALIDLLAIAPPLVLLSLGVDLRWVRLARLLRLLRLTRFSPALGLLGSVLHAERKPLAVSFSVLLTILVFASAGIHLIEGDVQPEQFGSIPAAMWWAIATLTTVGYGDVTPVTPLGKVFAGVITLTGMGMVSLPAGIIASGFTEAVRARREALTELVEDLAAHRRCRAAGGVPLAPARLHELHDAHLLPDLRPAGRLGQRTAGPHPETGTCPSGGGGARGGPRAARAARERHPAQPHARCPGSPGAAGGQACPPGQGGRSGEGRRRRPGVKGWGPVSDTSDARARDARRPAPAAAHPRPSGPLARGSSPPGREHPHPRSRHRPFRGDRASPAPVAVQSPSRPIGRSSRGGSAVASIEGRAV